MSEVLKLRDWLTDTFDEPEKSNTDIITIPVEEHNRLCNAESKLIALENCGVDNWSGYDIAMEELNDEV